MENKARELYVVKEHKVCQSYFIDYAEQDGDNHSGFYIKPGTASLFKAIDEQQAKAIYNSMMDFIQEIQKKKEYQKNSGGQVLNDVDISNIRKHLGEQISILSETDRDTTEKRIEFLCSAFKNNDDIIYAIRYAFNMDVTEELLLSEVLFASNYGGDSANIFESAIELSEIGERVSKYTFAQLYQCDTEINTDELSAIIDKVYNFVHMYGLLGILTKVFAIPPSIYLTYADIESANVETLIGEVIDKIEPDGYTTAEHRHRYSMMNMSKYIKLFFPDKTHMKFYEEYALMDSRFWVAYCEPLNWFLIAARAFYEECKRIKCSGINNKPLINFNNINMQYGFDDEVGINVFRMEFNSLYDAIRYIAAYSVLRENPEVLICEYCSRLFLKGDQRERRFCSGTCAGRSRKDSFNEKKKLAKKKVSEDVIQSGS